MWQASSWRAASPRARSDFSQRLDSSQPELWVYLAAAAETLSGICLVLGICTRYAALGAAAVLGVAVYALQMVKGFGWTWNTGGYEYPVFWALVSLMVAIDAWKKALNTRRLAPGPAVVARA